MRTEAAQAAAIIRKELKKNGIKGAKVRSENYSGGSSVNVTLPEDLLPATVKKITDYCNQFQYGHFDGMTDMYEYSNSNADLPQAKFVFVTASYSDEVKAAARKLVEEVNGVPSYDIDSHVWRILNGSSTWFPEFWANYKPRVKAA